MGRGLSELQRRILLQALTPSQAALHWFQERTHGFRLG